MGAFYGRASMMGKEGNNEALSDMVITWAPVIMNVTFFFTPCVGALIDRRGFGLPVFCLAIAVLWSTSAMWLLPLSLQWLTLLGINIVAAFNGSIQYSYIATTYSSEQFGLLMSICTLWQSAVNYYINVAGGGVKATSGVAVFVPPLVVFGIWAVVEIRREARS